MRTIRCKLNRKGLAVLRAHVLQQGQHGQYRKYEAWRLADDKRWHRVAPIRTEGVFNEREGDDPTPVHAQLLVYA